MANILDPTPNMGNLISCPTLPYIFKGLPDSQREPKLRGFVHKFACALRFDGAEGLLNNDACLYDAFGLSCALMYGPEVATVCGDGTILFNHDPHNEYPPGTVRTLVVRGNRKITCQNCNCIFFRDVTQGFSETAAPPVYTQCPFLAFETLDGERQVQGIQFEECQYIEENICTPVTENLYRSDDKNARPLGSPRLDIQTSGRVTEIDTCGVLDNGGGGGNNCGQGSTEAPSVGIPATPSPTPSGGLPTFFPTPSSSIPGLPTALPTVATSKGGKGGKGDSTYAPTAISSKGGKGGKGDSTYPPTATSNKGGSKSNDNGKGGSKGYRGLREKHEPARMLNSLEVRTEQTKAWLCEDFVREGARGSVAIEDLLAHLRLETSFLRFPKLDEALYYSIINPIDVDLDGRIHINELLAACAPYMS